MLALAFAAALPATNRWISFFARMPTCHRVTVAWRTLIVLFTACAFPALAQAPSTNVALRPLGHSQFKLGSVKLDKNARSVSFAAQANLVEELAVEYALVHNIGKLHESLFRTETAAQEIQVAMLLLGAKPAMTNAFPEDLSVAPPGDKVQIEVSWTNNGTVVRRNMEDLILNRATGKALVRGAWVYNGSNFSEGMFTAQRDGSLISIHIDPDALINNPRPGRDNDDLHVPFTGRLPASGTPVEVTIRLEKPKNEKQIPAAKGSAGLSLDGEMVQSRK